MNLKNEITKFKTSIGQQQCSLLPLSLSEWPLCRWLLRGVALIARCYWMYPPLHSQPHHATTDGADCGYQWHDVDSDVVIIKWRVGG